jgi:hypothetical protein
MTLSSTHTHPSLWAAFATILSRGGNLKLLFWASFHVSGHFLAYMTTIAVRMTGAAKARNHTETRILCSSNAALIDAIETNALK